jgi:hypothetical protein
MPTVRNSSHKTCQNSSPDGPFYGNPSWRLLKLVVVVLRAPSSSKHRMTQLERHDWKRQPMFEVHMPIAIPQNLWQDVGQNAAAIVLQSETNEWTRLK